MTKKNCLNCKHYTLHVAPSWANNVCSDESVKLEYPAGQHHLSMQSKEYRERAKTCCELEPLD